MHKRQFLLSTLALAGNATLAQPAATTTSQASGWQPTRPIDLLVSFPAGGTADALARIVARRLAERRKWTVVVSNRAGGGGAIMHNALQAARLDGHTIALEVSHRLTYSSLERSVAPDLDDFTFLAGLGRTPHCLVSRPEANLDSFDKLRAHAKSKGSVFIGVGAPFDWLAPRFGQELGINAVGVPFKGGAEMMQAVMGRHIDLSWSSGSHDPLVKAGSLKVAFALTGDRLPEYPTVPTLRELGSKLVLESRFLIMGAKGLPPQIAGAITGAIGELMEDPAMQADVARRGLVPAFLDGAQLRRGVEAEAALARSVQASAAGK